MSSVAITTLKLFSSGYSDREMLFVICMAGTGDKHARLRAEAVAKDHAIIPGVPSAPLVLSNMN